jgi:hypothetical protein
VARLRGLRNFAIVALVALAIVVTPGGGTGLSVMLWLLSVAFFASIALLGARLFDVGGAGVLLWLAILGLCSYGIYWVWRHASQYG